LRNVSLAYAPSFDPNAPFADAHGLVASPNVDFANEAIQSLTARYSFAMNAQVMPTFGQMMKALLDTKA
jgi:flagellar basal-body rod protein FlgC